MQMKQIIYSLLTLKLNLLDILIEAHWRPYELIEIADQVNH